MKRLIILLFFCSAAFGQYNGIKPMLGRQVNKAHQLGDFIGCLLMNEGAGSTVADLSGNNFTGTFVADTHWIPGKFGLVTKFDGTGDYIDCGNQQSVQLASRLSVVLWVKFNSLAAETGVIGKYTHVSPEKGWAIRAYPAANNQIYFGFRKDTNNYWGRKGSTNISTGTWYQIAIVYPGDGTNPSLYLNGKIETLQAWLDAGDALNGFADSGTNLQIGWGSIFTATDKWLNGEIDDVLIYNRALSASEISQLYREPFCMFKDPLPVTMMYDWAVAAPAGQVIMISTIPVILLAGCLLYRRMAA